MSEQSSDKKLYGRCSQEIYLTDVLKKCVPLFGSAIGLFYSPTQCFFGKVVADQVTGHDGHGLALKDVFEARVFNERGELRWLNERDGHGRAVLISEKVINSYLDHDLPEVDVIDSNDQQYLLWGEGTGGEAIEGWSCLSAARIGKLVVPIPGVERNERVRLQVCEYLSVNDCHGNVVVAEERLWGLQKLVSKQEKT
jgi:CRISPR-associated protein (TIGR03984 family)